METVYFSEDMAEAQEAVQATLDQYQKLLDQLSENQRQDVLRTIGLRMEELKAQEQALKDAVLESHWLDICHFAISYEWLWESVGFINVC